MKQDEFRLTNDQQRVFARFQSFIANAESRVFILQGYAGTGKTTLIRFLIDELKRGRTPYSLLASTGRAAKVVSDATGVSATTVHSLIYSFKDFNQDLEKIVEQEDKYGIEKTGQLFLKFELTPLRESFDKPRRVYIVDEASMISDVRDLNANQAEFGSGKLLSDLLNYDKRGLFIFVGDECQLPPVMQRISPALSRSYFKDKFGITAIEMTLTQIVRQQEDNTIVQASHRIRALYNNPPQVKWGMLPLKNYKHIHLNPDIVAMINHYIGIISGAQYNNASFISYSNAKCNQLNNLIRKTLGNKEQLQEGDLLLVTQNNTSGLMNGDMVVVEQIKPIRHQRAQLSFLLVEVREIISNKTRSMLLIEDILYGELTNLSQVQQKALFVDFYRRMREMGIKQKDPEFKDALNSDQYLNALRCVYGYAITCHKAQGGEWKDVFVDIRRNLTLSATSEAYQWIYTAVTRAKERLHVVNDFFISD